MATVSDGWCLSIFAVRPVVVLFVVFLCSGFRSPLSPFALIHHSVFGYNNVFHRGGRGLEDPYLDQIAMEIL